MRKTILLPLLALCLLPRVTRAAGAAPDPPDAVDVERISQKIELPSSPRQVVAGGGGRFLIAHCPDAAKLAVVDVLADPPRVVKEIAVPAAAGAFHFAAGAESLLVFSNTDDRVRRWDLLTLEQDRTFQAPDVGAVHQAAMGCESYGPVLVAGSAGVFLLDGHTLKPLKAELDLAGWSDIGDRLRLAASPDGRTFGGHRPGTSPSGVFVLTRLDDNPPHSPGGRWAGYYEHDAEGNVVPARDGRTLYTSVGIRVLEKPPAKPDPAAAASRGRAHGMIGKFPGVKPLQGSWGPVYGTAYAANLRGGGPRAGAAAGYTLTVYADPAGVPLADLPPPPFKDSYAGGALYDRVWVIPAADVVVTMPRGEDREQQPSHLTAVPFDLAAAAAMDGSPYLFVKSLPPRPAVRGRPYRYPLDIKSSSGGVSCKLERGPKGMTLTKAGLLEWNSPAPGGKGTEPAEVRVLVSDSSGRKAAHTFLLRVREASEADGAAQK